MRSGAQPPIGSTWHLGSVSEPRPPVGCSPRVKPFPPRPPPEVAFLCSVASSVLRPHPTSHPRTYSAYGYCLPEPARTSPGTGETSQVPHKELLHVRKVSDCARFFPCKPLRHGRCRLLVSELDRHLGIRPVSQLNTRPRGLPCERFTAALASRTSCITRGRGGWLDLPRGGLSPPILCQLSWRTPLWVRSGRRAPPPLTAGYPQIAAVPGGC